MSDMREELAKLIEHMLTEVEGSLEQGGRTNDFIESLRFQFDKRGTLSERQVEALQKFYDRVA
jgi:hypothetical protein